VAVVPPEPEVIVSRGRRLPRSRGAHVRFAELAPADVDGVATSAARTLLDCLRTLPYDQALAVADSALLEEGCRELLTSAADHAAGPGSRQVRLVAARADGRAANPFESTLRALCHQVEGLTVEPQVEISEDGFYACVDLADRRLRIVCEADSFEWHGGRDALAADAERYNELVVQGWLVLRFSYEQVMHRPQEVLRTLRRVVALAELLNERGSRAPAAA
jgi:very-short-patch-repair endonuclease